MYVSAMPIDALKKLLPQPWREQPYFAKLASKLRGVPVMNVHVWFDRKLSTINNNLIFSRSPILSVYADMSETCQGYANTERSMLELVVAPAAPYMMQSDDQIQHLVLQELERLFPEEIRADGSLANVVKFTCIRTPTSVYETVPGAEEARPTQKSPVVNFFCAGDFSKQMYLASMEGAVLSGILAAKEVALTWLEQERDDNFIPARQLTQRPKDPTAHDATERVPDRTMYVTKTSTGIPDEVRIELETQNRPALFASVSGRSISQG